MNYEERLEALITEIKKPDKVNNNNKSPLITKIVLTQFNCMILFIVSFTFVTDVSGSIGIHSFTINTIVSFVITIILILMILIFESIFRYINK